MKSEAIKKGSAEQGYLTLLQFIIRYFSNRESEILFRFFYLPFGMKMNKAC